MQCIQSHYHQQQYKLHRILIAFFFSSHYYYYCAIVIVIVIVIVVAGACRLRDGIKLAKKNLKIKITNTIKIFLKINL